MEKQDKHTLTVYGTKEGEAHAFIEALLEAARIPSYSVNAIFTEHTVDLEFDLEPVDPRVKINQVFQKVFAKACAE